MPTSTAFTRCTAVVGCLALVAAQAAAVEGLVSVKVAAPIALDGTIEAAWEQAPALKLNLDKAPYKPDVYGGKDENRYWIPDGKKVPFVDTFKAGDVIGSVVVKPFDGSRGDIACASKWADGMWTIEFKRKLVTAGEQAAQQDVQFSDLTKAYAFGVAVFDNAQINHLYHGGSPKLTFKP